MMCVNCGCDAEVPDTGRMLNRHAYLGSQIVSMRERILQLEKTARKTFVAERKEVEDAKVQLVKAKVDLEHMVAEKATLTHKLRERMGTT